jgi:hypothetical protein
MLRCHARIRNRPRKGVLAQRCRGLEEAWVAQDLKRAMILISGLDEEMAQRILDQEGI